MCKLTFFFKNYDDMPLSLFSLQQRIKAACRPGSTWGPADPILKEKYRYDMNDDAERSNECSYCCSVVWVKDNTIIEGFEYQDCCLVVECNSPVMKRGQSTHCLADEAFGYDYVLSKCSLQLNLQGVLHYVLGLCIMSVLLNAKKE